MPASEPRCSIHRRRKTAYFQSLLYNMRGFCLLHTLPSTHTFTPSCLGRQNHVAGAVPPLLDAHQVAQVLERCTLDNACHASSRSRPDSSSRRVTRSLRSPGRCSAAAPRSRLLSMDIHTSALSTSQTLRLSATILRSWSAKRTKPTPIGRAQARRTYERRGRTRPAAPGQMLNLKLLRPGALTAPALGGHRHQL